MLFLSGVSLPLNPRSSDPAGTPLAHPCCCPVPPSPGCGGPRRGAPVPACTCPRLCSTLHSLACPGVPSTHAQGCSPYWRTGTHVLCYFSFSVCTGWNIRPSRTGTIWVILRLCLQLPAWSLGHSRCSVNISQRAGVSLWAESWPMITSYRGAARPFP